MTSGKILATVVGITAAAILISQLSGSKSEPEIVENFLTGFGTLHPSVQTITYPAGAGGSCGAGVQITPAQQKSMATLGSGKKLTSHLPDSVFFGNAQYDMNNISQSTNMAGAGATYGAQVQALMNPGSSAQQTFRNFEAAAGVIEGYNDGASKPSHSHSHSHGHKKHRHGHKHASKKVHLTPTSSSFGCGPEGTIQDAYGANVLGSDFHALNRVELPTDGFTGSELPAAGFSVTNADGTMSSHYSVDRLMYSTSKRARCNGAVDYIRGDLAIAPCPIAMMPAAKPYDTLEAGAFGALFGTSGQSVQDTIALISDSKARGGFSTLAGADMAELVEQDAMNGTLGVPVLTQATFATTSANALMDAQRTSTDNAVGSSTQSGDVTVYSGYTDFQ